MDQIVVAILGILAAAYAYHLLQKVRSTKEHFVKNTDDFRKPFLEAKMIFDSSTKGIYEKSDITETFIQLFTKQKRAVAAFEQILPGRFKIRIREAWVDHENYLNNEIISKWFGSHNLFKTDDEISEKRKAAIDKIDKILFFSNYHNIYSIFRIMHKPA